MYVLTFYVFNKRVHLLVKRILMLFAQLSSVLWKYVIFIVVIINYIVAFIVIHFLKGRNIKNIHRHTYKPIW